MTRIVPDHIWAAMTIWAEARGEIWEGQIAVGEVIRNRTDQKFSSDGSVASTILWPYQLSCWNTKDPNRAKMAMLMFDNKMFNQCLRAWNDCMAGTEFTKGALFYCNLDAVSENPSWIAHSVQTVKIGQHRFYKPKDEITGKG